MGRFGKYRSRSLALGFDEAARLLRLAWHLCYTSLGSPKSPIRGLKSYSRKLARSFRSIIEAAPRIPVLKAEYRAKGLDAEPDTFVLYRILGNDLYPRHERGQTYRNLKFILDHEPQLEACEKRWVVNRIVDPGQEASIIELLLERRQTYLHLPFDSDVYAQIGWDWESFPDGEFFQSSAFANLPNPHRTRAEAQKRRLKNNYVMNNNGARNAALREGRNVAKWVAPWDGNCFITSAAWISIAGTVKAKPYLKYFTVPMARLTVNELLLDSVFRPAADGEPQILFRRDALEEFNEAHPYGRRSKVELFWRLKVPGPWDSWIDDPWDLPRANCASEAGQFSTAGWVARLTSGHLHLDGDDFDSRKSRRYSRHQAICATLDTLDAEIAKRRC
jgi:hypothetical protein